MIAKRRNAPSSKRKALNLYFSELSTIPLLSAEEEKALGYRAGAGDEMAIQKLVESNLRFVIKVAKRYRGRGMPFSDLIHEGNLGLIEAARRFDPDRNVKFISYAIWWIRQSILVALSSMGQATKLPPRITHALHKINRSRKKILLEKHSVDIDELANEVGVSRTELEKVLSMRAISVSLYQPVRTGADLVYEEILASEKENSVESQATFDSAKRLLRDAIDKLNHREQIIVKLRFGLDNDRPQTLSEIGSQLGLSRERVRQIEVEALEKLSRNTRSLKRLSA